MGFHSPSIRPYFLGGGGGGIGIKALEILQWLMNDQDPYQPVFYI